MWGIILHLPFHLPVKDPTCPSQRWPDFEPNRSFQHEARCPTYLYSGLAQDPACYRNGSAFQVQAAYLRCAPWDEW